MRNMKNMGHSNAATHSTPVDRRNRCLNNVGDACMSKYCKRVCGGEGLLYSGIEREKNIFAFKLSLYAVIKLRLCIQFRFQIHNIVNVNVYCGWRYVKMQLNVFLFREVIR